MLKRLLASVVVVFMVAVAAPATANAKGFIEDALEYGFFYGTFDESPNVALFAGGPLEEFCGMNDPGTVPLRVFLRSDGTVDLKVNAKGQPIYLYETEFNDIPEWLGAICPTIAAGDDPPAPFATGEDNLKVRISVLSDSVQEIFNSVNGKATGTDGTEYRVRGTADLVVQDGVPVGDPRDFVGFKLTEIRR
jgi:hypothetical protein